MAAGLGKRSKINGVFHDDLLGEVLQRAPPESVARCKAVCKRWRNLISTPFFFGRFCGHHHQLLISGEEECVATRCSTKGQLFIFHPRFERQFSLDFLPFDEAAKRKKFVMGFCEGLFLCEPDDGIADEMFYHIANPITKNWVGLPASPKVRSDFEIAVGFAYYPGLSGPRFKIVQILSPIHTDPVSDFEVDIFCSWTGNWARGTVTFPEPIMWTYFMLMQAAVFYKGYLHWMDGGMRTILYDVENDAIACVLNRPEGAAVVTEELFCFGTCGGRFYASELHQATLRIWELKHLQGQRPEWSIQRQVHIPIIPATRSLPLLAIHPWDMNVVYIGYGKRAISCNLRTYTLKPICRIVRYRLTPLRLPHIAFDMTYSIMFPPWPTSIPNTENVTSSSKKRELI
ncbi:unnamed protein product [Cuscuta epithymum]|uniref:F-box domain-containing protein n=1 Tax=Cuscuta epithymum TaxID=186058 RepID=A0AAV0G2Q9_9ASTE|nr:unnamed protein product [Cuscuta epithymum]